MCRGWQWAYTNFFCGSGTFSTRTLPSRLNLQHSILWGISVLILCLSGCASLGSLRGTTTENLREWKREDPQRKKLIVFVHGFNSSKEGAWGQFPDLVKDDSDNFDAYNIHLFGYPSKGCRNVNDIQDEGEYLASFLKETLPAYESTVLMGHSMGGLVILHALLALDQSNFELINHAEIKVLTFATPHSGVEGAGVLSLLCADTQAGDMEALNTKLFRLKEGWRLRFNRIHKLGERETPQVPLFAFRGRDDHFVTEASACGDSVTSCEVVDGDHISIVKPTTRQNLAYLKLKALAKTPKVKPTAKEKVGIWVARIGGTAGQGAQGNIVENLKDHIARESELRHVVEIRELPVSIEGSTDDEEKIEAERLGKQYNAAVLVWGKITGLFTPDEFHPRVMLVARAGLTTESVRLSPVTVASHQRAQMSAPPGIVGLPGESIREPVQLARFVTAFTFFEQERWTEAARQFQEFIKGGLSSLKIPDVYFYAGYANMKTYEKMGSLDLLERAKENYLKALAGYQQEGSQALYTNIQNNLGLVYEALAERGVEPKQNFQRSLAALEEAARLDKEQENWAGYARDQNNLGATYRELAERGVAPKENLQHALDALEEAARLDKKYEDWTAYARDQNNLALTYRTLAVHGVAPKENLQRSLAALEEAARLAKEQQHWAGYAKVQANLGATYRELAKRSIEPEQNLRRSLAPLEEAARLLKEQQNWAGYAKVQTNLGLTSGRWLNGASRLRRISD